MILAAVLVLFGSRRLLQIGRGLGNGFLNFRKEIDQLDSEAGESLGGIFGKHAAEALTPRNQVDELYHPAALQNGQTNEGAENSSRFHLGPRFWRMILRLLFRRRG